MQLKILREARMSIEEEIKRAHLHKSETQAAVHRAQAEVTKLQMALQNGEHDLEKSKDTNLKAEEVYSNLQLKANEADMTVRAAEKTLADSLKEASSLVAKSLANNLLSSKLINVEILQKILGNLAHLNDVASTAGKESSVDEEVEDQDAALTTAQDCVQLDPPCNYTIRVNGDSETVEVVNGVIPRSVLRAFGSTSPFPDQGAVSTSGFMCPVNPHALIEVEVYIFSSDSLVLIDKISILPHTETCPVKATAVKTSFQIKDKPVAGASVSGTFETKEGEMCSISGVTDEHGIITLGLPLGKIRNFQAIDPGSKTTIVKQDDLEVHEPQLGECGESFPQTLIIAVEGTHFIARGKRVVVLGDVSGSMGPGEGSKCMLLKDSLKRSFVENVQAKGLVAFARWNGSTEWCMNRWMSEDDKEKCFEWVEKLHGSGSTHMQQAMESSLSSFPDATDVYVMCDGDITPFNLQTWERFYGDITPMPGSKEKAKIHFIAVGEDASHGEMEKMANLSKGASYFEYFKLGDRSHCADPV